MRRMGPRQEPQVRRAIRSAPPVGFEPTLPPPERVSTIQRIVSGSDVCPGQKAILNSVGNGVAWLKAAIQCRGVAPVLPNRTALDWGRGRRLEVAVATSRRLDRRGRTPRNCPRLAAHLAYRCKQLRASRLSRFARPGVTPRRGTPRSVRQGERLSPGARTPRR